MHALTAFIIALALWLVILAEGVARSAWWTPYLAGGAPIFISGVVLVAIGLAELAAHLRGRR